MPEEQFHLKETLHIPWNMKGFLYYLFYINLRVKFQFLQFDMLDASSIKLSLFDHSS